MNVAYDLRFASDHFVGIGTYAHAVLEGLLGLEGEERYTVLWDPRQSNARYDMSRFRTHARVTWDERPLPPLSPRSLIGVGAWLRSLRPALYLSPYHLVPFGMPCPSIVTLHDVRPLRHPSDPWRARLVAGWTMRRARAANWITTVSDFSRREILVGLGVPPARVRTIAPGVQPDLLTTAPERPNQIPEGSEGFLLVVGDNRPHKNLATLAAAWASLGPAPPWRLVTAGPVDARFPSLADYVRNLGGAPIRELGRVSQSELCWLYRRARLLLFPSRYEGFGSPLAEAMAFGLPAIVADIPALRETGAGACVYANPDDVAAWATAIRSLVGDEVARQGLSERGRARARELSYDRTARETLALVREAVA